MTTISKKKNNAQIQTTATHLYRRILRQKKRRQVESCQLKCQVWSHFNIKKTFFLDPQQGLPPYLFLITHYKSHLNWQSVLNSHTFIFKHTRTHTPVHTLTPSFTHVHCTHMPTWHKAWHTGHTHYRNAKLPVAKETCGRGRVPCCCHSSRLAPCQLSPSGRNKARGGGVKWVEVGGSSLIGLWGAEELH